MALSGNTKDGAVWTYSADPATSDRDAVRFLLGDVDPADPLISDPAVDFLLREWSYPYLAASAAAEEIASQFAREVTYAADGVQAGLSELQDKFMSLAERLRVLYRNKSMRTAKPYAGGISNSDMDIQSADTDQAGTFFRLGMTDNDRAGSEGPAGTNKRNPLVAPPPGANGGA